MPSEDIENTVAEEPEYTFLFKIGGKAGDASLEISLSPDEMQVLGKFSPPSGGKLLVYQEIEDTLIRLGITQGLQMRTIQECIFHCNMHKKNIDKVPLARGTLPRKEAPAFIKLEAHLFDHSFADEKNKNQVDYKAYSPFVIVKKGELLARAVKPREGVPGLTVKGDNLPFGKKEVKFLRPGPHTIYAHGKVFARCAGRFVVEKDIFDVSDTLEIKGGVDYSTGHIIFPGNISVGGIVKDGFKIVSGASITTKDTLDASEVLCKKDLLCGGGIIGKKPAIVRVGGLLRAQFIENCQVEALGGLHVLKTILGCRIYTNGSLQMDEGSRIIATSVWAKGSVTVHHLGNESGHCHIIAGTDFVVARKLEAMRKQYREEEVLLDKVRDRLEGSDAHRLEEVLKEGRTKIQNLVSEINALQKTLISEEPFEIRVRGEIHSGTVIEMGYARLEINSPQSAKIYKLSKDHKAIIAEKYSDKHEGDHPEDSEGAPQV